MMDRSRRGNRTAVSFEVVPNETRPWRRREVSVRLWSKHSIVFRPNSFVPVRRSPTALSA